MINLKNIAVLLFSLVVPGLAIAQTEVLYNGIHLPEQWPPRYAEPQKAQDMPIPYLEQKPGVIPADISPDVPWRLPAFHGSARSR